MKRCIFPGQRPKTDGKIKRLPEKNLKIIFKFRTSCMNPFNNKKLALKVTFKSNVTEPEIKIESENSVAIYDFKSYEILAEKSSNYIEHAFTVIKDSKNENKLIIKMNDDSETLFIQLPETTK